MKELHTFFRWDRRQATSLYSDRKQEKEDRNIFTLAVCQCQNAIMKCIAILPLGGRGRCFLSVNNKEMRETILHHIYHTTIQYLFS